jgi:hypothetical protein
VPTADLEIAVVVNTGDPFTTLDGVSPFMNPEIV